MYLLTSDPLPLESQHVMSAWYSNSPLAVSLRTQLSSASLSDQCVINKMLRPSCYSQRFTEFTVPVSWLWIYVLGVMFSYHNSVSCVVFFDFHTLLCLLSFKCLFFGLPSVSLCLLVFSSVLLPLVTSPGLLPPLSPHLFLVWSFCVFSLWLCPNSGAASWAAVDQWVERVV